MTLPPIEGSWWGPDKIAHFLVPLVLSGWIMVFRPRWYAWGPILGVFGGLAWELSNALVVLEGERGVSLYDAMGFLAGGLLAGLLSILAYARTAPAGRREML